MPNLPSGDYVSPGLEIVEPDAAFPHMSWRAIGEPVAVSSPRDHNWYVDERNPTIGFLSRDEAAILFNTARLFQGRTCLEIGCWRGWSTVHLALGSGNVEVIDPALRDTVFREDVAETFRRAGVLDRLVLHDGASPEEVERISAGTGKRWSLAFIDGDHEGDAPRRDAEVVSRFAAEDAAILFYDLVSPHVAAGLEYLRSQGWRTWIYQTMQIMGVAVRGAGAPRGAPTRSIAALDASSASHCVPGRRRGTHRESFPPARPAGRWANHRAGSGDGRATRRPSR
jgi:predicted O-methyltransferase YrrM